VWNYTTGGQGVVYSSPAVVNGVVYVGSDDANLYALNATTGAKVWNYTTGGIVFSSPAVANGTVYVGSWDGHLYALDAATGAFKWSYGTGIIDRSSPAVANGVVYIGSNDATGGSFYALDANTGAKVWNYTTGNGWMQTSPAVVNGVVYVGGYALDANTGAKVWNSDTGSREASPAVANGVVYIGTYALNATNGKVLWQSPLGSGGAGAPAVANGVVYVCDDVNLYALDATTGAKVWNYTTEYPMLASPAVVDGVVYIGTWGRNVYAIGNRTTSLTAEASNTVVAASTNFTINGTLSGSTTGILGAMITLQRSTDSATWNNVTTNVTNATGGYQFSKNESVGGTYYYRAAYDGNESYDNATSNVATVTVNKIPTQLSASANPTTVVINQLSTVSGTLNTTDGIPLSDATVQLQKNVSGTWTDVAGKTNTTQSDGSYAISTSEPLAGAYQYRTTYAGNDTFVNSIAVSVTVTVNKIQTQLSAATNLTSVWVNSPFTTNGTLNTTDGTAIAGATIQLQKNVSGTWQDVTGKTNTTTSTGAYRISTSELASGAYQYRTIYAGNDTYTNATSIVKSVTVSMVPIKLASSPAASAQDANTLDVFAKGTNNALWHTHWDGTTWSAWESLGGVLTSAPAATSNGAGNVSVFVRGSDSALWMKASTDGGNTWSGWQGLGGQIPAGTAPAVCSWGAGRIDLLVQGTDGQLWWKYTTNGGSSWSAWQGLGGKLTSSPAAAAPASGILDVFVRGGDNGLWQKTYNSGVWTGWTSVGGT